MTGTPAATGRGADAGRPGLIGRRDLVALLDQAAAKQVTIISAPAGSGKTSGRKRSRPPAGRARRS